jgi:hypothetical protein
MRGIFIARCVVVMGTGLTLMVAQGCRKQATAPALAQTEASSGPRVQPDFAVGPLPVEDVDQGATPRADRTARRRQPAQPMQPVQAQNTDAEAAAIAVVQRRQDARLLQQQQAASERQQQELNQEIEEDMRTQQEMEAEPRIQDTPGAPQPMQPQ